MPYTELWKLLWKSESVKAQPVHDTLFSALSYWCLGECRGHSGQPLRGCGGLPWSLGAPFSMLLPVSKLPSGVRQLFELCLLCYIYCLARKECVH